MMMHASILLAAFLLPQIAPEEYTQRSAALAERLSNEPAVIEAIPMRRIDRGGAPHQYDFIYLAGFHEEGALLVLKGRTATLFVKDPAKVETSLGRVVEREAFSGWAAKNLSGARRIHARLGRSNQAALSRALPKAKIGAGLLASELVQLRLIKSEAEQKFFRKAADATCRGLKQAAGILRPGMNEREIQERIEETFRKEGCDGPGFPSICGSGKNGTILHYHRNDAKIPAGTLMVCDVGAKIGGYTADVTRTFPTSGRFSPEQRRCYEAVLEAQKAAEKMLRPGVSSADLDRAAAKVLADRGMKRWSFAHSKDFSVRHGGGHFVGLYVHDSGSNREKFRPGMVVTIEPGWYDKSAGYGVRIEDIYLVTEDGFERLSASMPRKADEIEKLLRPTY
jgi:Xaa-Pro aminopeptidase